MNCSIARIYWHPPQFFYTHTKCSLYAWNLRLRGMQCKCHSFVFDMCLVILNLYLMHLLHTLLSAGITILEGIYSPHKYKGHEFLHALSVLNLFKQSQNHLTDCHVVAWRSFKGPTLFQVLWNSNIPIKLVKYEICKGYILITYCSTCCGDKL